MCARAICLSAHVYAAGPSAAHKRHSASMVTKGECVSRLVLRRPEWGRLDIAEDAGADLHTPAPERIELFPRLRPRTHLNPAVVRPRLGAHQAARAVSRCSLSVAVRLCRAYRCIAASLTSAMPETFLGAVGRNANHLLGTFTTVSDSRDSTEILHFCRATISYTLQ